MTQTTICEVRLDVDRVSDQDVIRMRAMKWEWVKLFNKLRNQPGGGAAQQHEMDVCRRAITIIDDACADRLPTWQ